MCVLVIILTSGSLIDVATGCRYLGTECGLNVPFWLKCFLCSTITASLANKSLVIAVSSLLTTDWEHFNRQSSMGVILAPSAVEEPCSH